MADHPNAKLLKDGYAAFAKGDMATLTNLFAEDVVWHASGNNQLAGTHKGRDAVFAIFAKTVELTGGSFNIEVHDVVANDDHTVSLTRAKGSREGRTLDSADVDVYHMKDGKVTEFWSFSEDAQKTDAFWS
ncbi:MAG: nuclear transport factor 2 family protein [Dehalococcoidia bacterium]